MKKVIWLFLVACTIERQIEMLTPGAEYIIHSGDYAGIEWLDKGQTQPTQTEMDQALSACQVSKASTEASKQQDVQTAKDPLKTDKERIDALSRIVLP